MDAVLKLVLGAYLDERCKYCGVRFATYDDLETAVWAGHHAHGRLAHKLCWDQHHFSLAEQAKSLMRVLGRGWTHERLVIVAGLLAHRLVLRMLLADATDYVGHLEAALKRSPRVRGEKSSVLAIS